MTTRAAPAFPATLGRAAFWSAQYPGGSGYCGQIPTLFWLTETRRPATVLSLGVETPEGYFAVCQAVKGLDLQALAWGFGHWPAGLPEAVRQHNVAHYAGFSRLAHLTAAEDVAGRFDAGLFDLILVDGRGLQGADAQALSTLLVRMSSPRGAILLQGLEAGPNAELLALLAATYPVQRFGTQTDCALIQTGADPLPPAGPENIAALDRLGASHLLAWQAAQSAGAEALWQAESDRLTREAAEAGRAVAALATVQAQRLRDVQVLTQRLEALTETLRQSRQDGETALNALRAEMQAAAEVAVQTAGAELAALRMSHFDEVSDLQSDLFVATQALTSARSEADATIAALTKAAAEADAHARNQAMALAEQQTRLATREAEMTALDQRIKGLEQDQALYAQANARQTTEIAALRQDMARRDARAQLLLKLRDWKIQRLGEKGRFGSPPGPAGGKLADEAAAVARHPLFDAAWYLSSYPDTQDASLSAAEHFLRHGFYEGRDPGPGFKLLDWLLNNPNALEQRKNPLLDPALAPAIAPTPLGG